MLAVVAGDMLLPAERLSHGPDLFSVVYAKRIGRTYRIERGPMSCSIMSRILQLICSPLLTGGHLESCSSVAVEKKIAGPQALLSALIFSLTEHVISLKP